MYLCGTLGCVAGVMFAAQNSAYRLMGFRDNAKEVAEIKERLDGATTPSTTSAQTIH